MKLGIMQPYFFPYVGYFSLIEYSDEFIFFDTPQYIKHGWINRNRILGQKLDSTYITVPIKGAAQDTPINLIEIDNVQKWKEKIYGQLTVYKKKAPYYNDVIEFLHETIDEHENLLSKLNIFTTEKVCKKIGITCKFRTFSQMKLCIEEVNAPDEWALYISKALNACEYVNPPGGVGFFDKKKYDQAGLKLSFLESNLKQYVQRIGKWIPGLSIIDIMMFCDDSEIRDIIRDYKFI